jgi:hypothetical protein
LFTALIDSITKIVNQIPIKIPSTSKLDLSTLASLYGIGFSFTIFADLKEASTAIWFVKAETF